MATAKQKAAQARFKSAAAQAKREGASGKRYAKRVGEILRGGGARISKLARRSGGGSPAKTSSGGSRTMGLGAAYEHTARMIGIASPAIDEALITNSSQIQSGQVFRNMKDRVLDTSYAANVAVNVVDGVIDAKTRHAAAMSRGSLTAWAPEAFLGVKLWAQGRSTGFRKAGIASLNEKASLIRNAYSPQYKRIDATPDFFIYRGLKHGGQLFRHLHARSNVVKKVAAPFTKLKRLVWS